MTAADFSQQSRDYRRIETAIRFLEDNFRSQPNLDQIADRVNLSKYHFSRLFKRWAGVSPIQFLQTLTLDYTKEKLSEPGSLLEVSLDAGLSGPGRLHDLFVTLEGVTPGEFKQMGAGLQIVYGYGLSPFGECLLAVTQRGICFLGFLDRGDRFQLFSQLEQTWPGAVFSENPEQIRSILKRIFGFGSAGDSKSFHLQVKGTNFQINVWQALLAIPPGRIVSYQDIAAHIGRPKAIRAAASAIAVNPVSYMIPCHRVITKSGKIHRYRWGTVRKKAILGWEAAAKQPHDNL